MRWNSFSFLLMTIAVLVLHLHAIIPHDHLAPENSTVLASEEQSSTPLGVLWHFDLGEDHLEVYKLSSETNYFSPFLCQIFIHQVPNLSRLNWVFSREESAIPPPLLGSKSLRAPPFFA